MTGPVAHWKPEPTPRKERKRLPATSAKRAALAPLRKAFVARILAERPLCEAGRTIGIALTGMQLNYRNCTVESSEVHEILSRARGGNIVDPDNVLALCHNCHAWTTTHPALATSVGLLRSAHG